MDESVEVCPKKYLKNLFSYLALTLVLSVSTIHSNAASAIRGAFNNSSAARSNDCFRGQPDTNAKKDPAQLKILFYLQDNVEIMDFAGPMEAFTDAGFDVKTVSLNGGPIVSQGVLKLTTDYTIDNAPKADILCFFGGMIAYDSIPPRLVNWITSVQKPQYYFTVCTGAFYLAKAGLLDNLTVTTYHTEIGKLQSRAPKAKVLANVRYVDNGRITTTAGISAGTDGAIHLIERILGRKAAQEAADVMEYEYWKPGNGLDLTSKPGKLKRLNSSKKHGASATR